MKEDRGASATQTGLSPQATEPQASPPSRASIPSAGFCMNCFGADWVCENHRDRPWGGMSSDLLACECGAGAPCPVCSPDMACAGRVETERDAILAWLRAQPESYSGWNDHDEHFDNGYNSAIARVIEAIAKREYASGIEARSDETPLAAQPEARARPARGRPTPTFLPTGAAMNDVLMDLARRVEEATGPDRELDAEIRCACHLPHERNTRPSLKHHKVVAEYEDGQTVTLNSAHFTASLDAAKSLYLRIPERIPADPRKATAAALRARATEQGERE